MEQNDNKPTFVWASETDLVFNEKTNIDTSEMDKTGELKTLGSFTIFIMFSPENFSEDQVTLFSHSDQSCWSLKITKDQGLVFGKEGKTEALQVSPTTHDNHIAITYNET